MGVWKITCLIPFLKKSQSLKNNEKFLLYQNKEEFMELLLHQKIINDQYFIRIGSNIFESKNLLGY